MRRRGIVILFALLGALPPQVEKSWGMWTSDGCDLWAGAPLQEWGRERLPTLDPSPIRTISNPYPEFNGLAVDPVNHEVVASDGNTKSLWIYDRRRGSSEVAEPLRVIHGPATGIGYIAGVAVDPIRREYYVANNDVEDRVVVFSHTAEGNALPTRVLYTPHQVWGRMRPTVPSLSRSEIYQGEHWNRRIRQSVSVRSTTYFVIQT